MAGRQPGRGLAQVHRREEDVSLAHPGPFLAEKVRVVGDVLCALRRQQAASLRGEVAVDLHVAALRLQLCGQRRVHLPGPVGQGRKHQHIAVPDLGRRLLAGHLQRPILRPPVLHSGAAAPAGGGQVRHVTIPPDPSILLFIVAQFFSRRNVFSVFAQGITSFAPKLTSSSSFSACLSPGGLLY